MHIRYVSILFAAQFSVGLSFGADPPIEFNRDIRPILSDKCLLCHGPDAAAKKIPLRLDQEAAAKADLGGRRAIAEGSPESSELVRRVTAEKSSVRMPPAYSGLKLSDREIELLKTWIAQGAKWQNHWSFVPPNTGSVPEVQLKSWVRNPIDNFVLARLEWDGLQPSPEAERTTLIRRASLDLTGLPPTPSEVDAFLKDHSSGAYERLVDRLLASPRYGERMAAQWLDASRYADTNGYQTDAERVMWRWRDWVIKAFNTNKPFDQFTVEQIAGDLLPNATLEQKIATGFNRNHRGNSEGGIVPEEYLVEYAVDRVETASTVFLGVTLGCARCHNHKYDPFTQREFYQMLAYFNNIPELGRYLKFGNTPPYIKAPTAEQQRKLTSLDEAVAKAKEDFNAAAASVQAAQGKWELSLERTADWALIDGLELQVALDEPGVSGVIGHAARFDGNRVLDAGDHGDFGFYDKFTVTAWINPESNTGAIVSRSEDKLDGEGWGVYLENGKVQVNLIKRKLDDSIRVETNSALDLKRWHHVAVSYDGSRLAAGVSIYVDGKPQGVNVLLDAINQDFRVKEPLRIGGRGGQEGWFEGMVDEVRVYSRVLTEEQVGMTAEPRSVGEIATIPEEKRTAGERVKLRHAYLEQGASPAVKMAWKTLGEARRAREAFIESIPTVMVMEEMAVPRDTFVLSRGAYDKPAEKVSRGVPAALPPLPPDAPDNRLGLARWLVDPSNPLTARVTVNRFWQMYFGTGIVKTPEDFGSQGEWPSHLGLLDWLATEFVRSGWDVKALQKAILTSATYRQSSKAAPDVFNKDPENRLLARGPRMRLPAEMVRDQALYASGLLVEEIGGPSVKPYQPAGLWSELGGKDYEPDRGEGLYRRSLYTFWKRTAPPPFMSTFDSATRESCTVRVSSTNTPLQALNLMNDVTFLEASRMLAQRAIHEAGKSPPERLEYEFRRVLARSPNENERGWLLDSLNYYRDRYETNRKAAEDYVAQGESARDASIDVAELAAYMAVASMIFNLDETITKE